MMVLFCWRKAILTNSFSFSLLQPSRIQPDGCCKMWIDRLLCYCVNTRKVDILWLIVLVDLLYFEYVVIMTAICFCLSLGPVDCVMNKIRLDLLMLWRKSSNWIDNILPIFMLNGTIILIISMR